MSTMPTNPQHKVVLCDIWEAQCTMCVFINGSQYFWQWPTVGNKFTFQPEHMHI